MAALKQSPTLGNRIAGLLNKNVIPFARHIGLHWSVSPPSRSRQQSSESVNLARLLGHATMGACFRAVARPRAASRQVVAIARFASYVCSVALDLGGSQLSSVSGVKCL